MATYALGDIQGCYDELARLLEHVSFDPATDRLIFVGDLVNRGPKSLKVLRFVRSLGPAALTVLGNHDFHLLAAGNGNRRHYKSGSLDNVLNAPDCAELLDWLRHQPVLYHHEASGHVVVHAGFAPQWDLATATRCARELESALRGPDYKEYLAGIYGNKPDLWDESLGGQDRLRFITNAFVRSRYCTMDGRLALKPKGKPGSQPEGLIPWFEVPGRRSSDVPIVFGHWSTLGLINGNNIHSIDTGCLWGGELTALRLDDGEILQIDCPGARKPG